MTLEELATIIDSRANEDPSQSWTAKLLAQDPDKSAQKFGEEAIEAVIAAVGNDRQELVKETADALYHLLVMLKSRDVPLSEVMAELDRRRQQSGLEEKASRKR